MIFNHSTEQRPLPLVPLLHKLLEECSSRNRDFSPAPRQTLQASLLRCLVALGFTSALRRPLFFVALAFLKGLLVVCVRTV